MPKSHAFKTIYLCFKWWQIEQFSDKKKHFHLQPLDA